jgi:hypothetical protein
VRCAVCGVRVLVTTTVGSTSGCCSTLYDSQMMLGFSPLSIHPAYKYMLTAHHSTVHHCSLSVCGSAGSKQPGINKDGLHIKQQDINLSFSLG